MKTDIDEFTENPEDIVANGNAKKKTPSEEQDDILLEGFTGATFRGKKLEPWSFARRKAAAFMGLRWFYIDESDREQIEKDGFYRGMDTDLVIFLFLVSSPAEIVLKAWRDPDKALMDAMRFGEKNNLEPGTDDFLQGMKIMSATFVAYAKASGKFVPAEGKVKKGKRRPN